MRRGVIARFAVVLVLALSACGAFGEVTQSSVNGIATDTGSILSNVGTMVNQLSEISTQQDSIAANISTIKTDTTTSKGFLETIKNKITESFTFSEGAMRILNNNGEITNNSWETKTYDSLASVFKEILTFQARNLKQLGMMSYNELNHYNTSIKPIYENIKTNNIAGNVQFIADYFRTNNVTANSGGISNVVVNIDMGIVSNIYDSLHSPMDNGTLYSLSEDAFFYWDENGHLLPYLSDINSSLHDATNSLNSIAANSAVLTNEVRGLRDSFVGYSDVATNHLSTIAENSTVLTNEVRGLRDSFVGYSEVATNHLSTIAENSSTLTNEVRGLRDSFTGYSAAATNYLSSIADSSSVLTNEFSGFHDSFSQYLNIYTNNFMSRFFGGSGTLYLDRSYGFNIMQSDGDIHNFGSSLYSVSSLSDYLTKDYDLKSFGFAGLNNYWYYYTQYYRTNNIPTYLRNIDLSSAILTNEFRGFHDSFSQYLNIYTNNFLARFFGDSDTPYQLNSYKSYYSADDSGGYEYNWPIVMSPSSLSEYLRLGFELQGKSYASLNNYAYNEMRYYQTNNIPTYLREIDAYLQTNKFYSVALDDLAESFTNDDFGLKSLAHRYLDDYEIGFLMGERNYEGLAFKDFISKYANLVLSELSFLNNGVYYSYEIEKSMLSAMEGFGSNGISVNNLSEISLDGLVVTNNLTLSVTNSVMVTNAVSVVSTNKLEKWDVIAEWLGNYADELEGSDFIEGVTVWENTIDLSDTNKTELEETALSGDFLQDWYVSQQRTIKLLSSINKSLMRSGDGGSDISDIEENGKGMASKVTEITESLTGEDILPEMGTDVTDKLQLPDLPQIGEKLPEKVKIYIPKYKKGGASSSDVAEIEISTEEIEGFLGFVRALFRFLWFGVSVFLLWKVLRFVIGLGKKVVSVMMSINIK